MDAAREQFAARGCSLLAVSQATPAVLALYATHATWHVPLVCDPHRTAYNALGLERTSWWTFFKPRVLGGYLRGIFRGYRVKRPYRGEDLLQLGGDFLITRERRLVFAYRSAEPTDRPSIPTLLRQLPSATPISHDRTSDASAH